MIPLRDVIPSRTFPVTTVVLIVLNAIPFLYEQTLSDVRLSMLALTWGVVPAAFDWARVLPAMFLHVGWLHAIANMACLWIFGDNVEARLGHGRFLAFYLLGGVLAVMAHAWTASASAAPVIGSSGAVAGVMGGYFVLYPHSRILTLVPLIVVWPLVEVPAVFLLGVWFILQVLSGAATPPAVHTAVETGGPIWTHAAAFGAGALLVALFTRPERARVEWWHD